MDLLYRDGMSGRHVPCLSHVRREPKTTQCGWFEDGGVECRLFLAAAAEAGIEAEEKAMLGVRSAEEETRTEVY